MSSRSDHAGNLRPGRLYNVHHCLVVNAKRFSDRPAVSDGDVSLTYRELDCRANQLAHDMIRRGITPGDHVGILFGNTIAHVVTIYAAAKAGAVSVVLDPKWVAREIDQSLSLFDCDLLVTDRIYADRLSPDLLDALPVGAVFLDRKDAARCDLTQAYSRCPDTAPTVSVASIDTFMIMLTSGTTGRPKGCVTTHEGYLHSCILNFTSKHMDQDGRELIVVPIYYNSGRMSLITQLSFGGSVHLRERFDPRDVLATIQDEKITSIALAPTQCNELLEYPALDSFDTSSLRMLRKAGLPFQKRVVKEIMDRICPHVFQAYGGTEFSEATVLAPAEQMAKIGSAGRPIWGTEVEIVDDQHQPVPAGQEGKIRVRSASVCGGYYNDADASAAAFIDGWYYSGDLGYLDEEGYLYVSGREKNVIKTGGINVAPAEIEDVLLAFPEIADVAIVGVPDPKWGTAIKALVVLRKGQVLEHSELVRRCGESLSRYKIPRIVEFVDQLQRNALGKFVQSVRPLP